MVLFAEIQGTQTIALHFPGISCLSCIVEHLLLCPNRIKMHNHFERKMLYYLQQKCIALCHIITSQQDQLGPL